MSDMRREAVDKIMRKFFNYVIVTMTWFLNYAEHDGAPAEDIAEMRAKVKELKDLMEHDRE
jgi:NAD-specific glutamate dehydrogenase